ncbi:MAG: polyribonucleotide nucleotidyltransferase [Firmicutes bacterium]|nr:polyribonucleotide nucleotidyltransferase [Bacillota bacterium]
MTDSYKKFETTIGGRKILVEVGALCGLSHGSCTVTCGETVVMANATMADKPREGQDWFPLGVEFEEKMYSVGKIPGGFRKREGRPTDSAILTSRLIDRPMRPLFPDGFFNDVSVVVTALSVDPELPPEPLGMLAASIAVSISEIPWDGPIGAVAVGRVNKQLIINPTATEQEQSDMHVVVAGTDAAVLMVEAGAHEVSEEDMLAAILFGHAEIKKQVEFIRTIMKKAGKEKREFDAPEIDETVEKRVRAFATSFLEKALTETDLEKRRTAESKVDEMVADQFSDLWEECKKEIGKVMYNIKKEIIRTKIIEKGLRPDGRKQTDIRPIWCATGMLPRVHGSAVFTRGNTQVLDVCTLGMISDAQRLDGLDDEDHKRYMHHYNMPPYATGEARNMRATSRREIGHGALAERAIEPLLPTEEEFPYAIRTVSEVLSSNGSSSMASVCASSMALMNAGVPLRAPVAGIAMGLIKDDKSDKIAVLSDIQGVEDFLGDMDFKVAGTNKGITAIQMDMKIAGIGEAILKTALAQAREGRLHILKAMNAEIDKPAEKLSKYAPKIIIMIINPAKIKDVIGSGGKVINKIIEETGVKIDIEDDGRVFIGGTDQAMIDRAKAIITNIVFEPEVGMEFDGKVMRTIEIGAFVEFSGKEGMIHISKLDKKRVEKVTDVVNVGDAVRVRVIKIDDKGRIDLQRIIPTSE